MTGRTRGRKYPGVYRRARSPYWWIKYTLPDGRVVRESSKTRSVMEAVKLRSMRLSGILPLAQAEKSLEPDEEPGPKTLREFAPVFLEVQKHLKSYTSLKGRVESLLRGMGDVPLESLSAQHFEKHRAGRLRGRKDRSGKVVVAPCAPATTNRELQALKNMIKKARSYGHVSRETFERIMEIKALREENTIIRYLSREEEEGLLAACIKLGQENGRRYGHLYPIVLMALRTGMRKSEILNLKREDVNLGKRIIHVVKSKSGKRRDVPIAADLLEVLRDVLGGHCMDYVFWHGKDKAEAFRDVRRSFKRALRKAGITGFRFHDARHHMASWYVMEGGNILHLQKILGHESVQMTERYAHLAPDFIEAATRVLDGHIQGCWAHSGHTGNSRQECNGASG